MNQWRFHVGGCTPQRLWELRWELFAFPEVCNVVHVAGDVVAVVCDDRPCPGAWVAVAREYGLALEPVAPAETELEAA